MRRTALALTLLAIPELAYACGGFFCNNTAPVEQTGEDIFFFINDGAGTVEAHVQVQYQGPSEDFAWIVPVADVPELGVGTEALFSTLAGNYTPQFLLDYEVEGECWVPPYDETTFGGVAAGTTTSATNWYADDGVNIVSSGEVGPYETVVLQADSSSALLTWLGDNGYDLPGSLDPVLAPYVSAGQYFVALKLLKDKDTGDLAPLVMTYTGTKASIPIQLTSIAATPDMRLRVNILGSARAVPENYLHLEINPFAVDWWTNGSNYDKVVTRAANEAGGQGFATDHAKSRDALGFAQSSWDTDELAAAPDVIAFIEMVQQQRYPADQILQDILDAHVQVPPELEDERLDIYNCPDCYRTQLLGLPFDAAAAAADIEDLIVRPRQDLDGLFGRPGLWLTRMTSSLSPAEMTVDPVFVINPDLPAVSRTRHATLIWECDPRYEQHKVPRRLVVEGYPPLKLPPEQRLWNTGYTEHGYILSLHEPSNALIEATAPAGAAEPIRDNHAEIAAKITAFNEENSADFIPHGPPHLDGDDGAEGCGCDVATAGATGWLLLPLLAAGLRRRRNR